MAYGSFEADGMTVESSSDTSDILAANLTPEPIIELEETPTPDQPDINKAEAEADAKAERAEAPPKPKPRNDPRARVEAATAKEATAKRERDEAKAEADKLRAELAAIRQKAEQVRQAPPPAEDPEPTVDKFDTYEKYVKAQARWEARQEIRDAEASRRQHEIAQAREGVHREQEAKFAERYDAAVTADPTFVEKVDPRLLSTQRLGVLKDPSKATFGNFLVEQIFQSEHPKDLLLHLSDPAIVQRLATLPPDQVIRDLAKFEARLDAAVPAPVSKAPAISHAKPPIRPVESSSVVADPSDLSGEEDVDEHIRKMNAKEQRERRAR